MKIVLRSFWRKDESISLKMSKNAALSKLIVPSSTSHEFDSDSDEFRQFLDLSADMPDGCWFQPIMHFNKKEIASINFFQLDCRGKLLKETKHDEELNLKSIFKSKLIATDDRIKIRLIDEIAISKIDLQNNSIGGMQLLEEFIISSSTALAFKSYGLEGFSLKPIYNPRMNCNHESFYQLYTSTIMPLAVLDISTLVRDDGDNISFRELGCITYDMSEVDQVKDFNRTAENWASNKMPVWVVSSRAKRCYEDNNLKGWHFRPVLAKGTSLYFEYLEKWEALFKKVNVNSKNRIS